MAKIIHFKERREGPPDNVITRRPWVFRRSDWENNDFLQMLKSRSHLLEKHRGEIFQKGGRGIWHLPPHYPLKRGLAYTARAAFLHRDNEIKMREAYYLAGLIDCMINQINPLLRTDLLRDMYRKIITMKSLLDMNWYGSIDQVLFPVDNRFYNDLEYREALSRAGTMKSLYRIIREGTDEMFDILSLEYVFYTPGRGM
jgi:hypothetical protein